MNEKSFAGDFLFVVFIEKDEKFIDNHLTNII